MVEVGTKSVFPEFTLGIHLKDSSLLNMCFLRLFWFYFFGFFFLYESKQEV